MGTDETKPHQAWDALQQQVAELIEKGEAPEAWKRLTAHPPTDVPGTPWRLLQCRVLLPLGRFETARELLEEVLVEEPAQEEALALMEIVKPATTAPELGSSNSAERSYATSIPSGFLDRLQAALPRYKYKGVQMVKNPFDMAIYQMLLWDVKPRTIIEVGSKAGGSALWLADLTRTFGLDTRILSVDIVKVEDVTDERVTFFGGDGRQLGATLTPELLATLARPWLVIEDADHAEKTTTAVLEFFDPLLQSGEYIVVEDGIISDLCPQYFPDYTSGPHQALKQFMVTRGEAYLMDANYSDFYGYNVTWATNGFLRKR